MKNFYTLLLFLFASVSILAQAPEKMSYQAVLRDASNTLLTNQEVGMQISILQTTATGTAVYVETQTPTTNVNGLVSLEIGTGIVVSGDFTTIDWSTDNYFIKTETDPAGGTTYTITGTSQLMSVPFAMYAKTSGNAAPGPQGAQGTQGIQGATGTAGTNGTQGIQGATGTNGTNGAQGIQGETGTNGTPGIQGEPGADGATGTNGTNGTQGIQGNIGSVGAVGATGTNGTNGVKGDTGITGDKGDVGEKGDTGDQGTQGIQGAIGTTGTNGTNGAKGDVGAKGEAGVAGTQGIQGAIGTAGTNGTNGAKGDVGEKGIQGIQGATGADGASGAIGATGADGASGETGAQGAIGATGLQGASGASGLTTAVNAIVQIDGNITITTTNIPEGDNMYYTEALVSGNADVLLNKSKVGQASGTTTGDMQYWNGTAWVVIATTLNEGAALQMISGVPTWIGGTPPPPPAIGDLRDGGIVFWVDGNGGGLVCALSDYSTTVEWGCNETDLPTVPNVAYNGGNPVPVGLGAEIGDGINNTNNILKDCSSASAALAARSLGPEWFLPSAKELNQMYIHKTTLEAVAGFSAFSDYYWSSTEYDFNTAWLQSFNSGAQDNYYKDDPDNVRAVRAF